MDASQEEQTMIEPSRASSIPRKERHENGDAVAFVPIIKEESELADQRHDDPRGNPTLPSSQPSSSRVGTPGPLYGLPEGVIVPSTVDPKLLQGRLLDTLKHLPVTLINDALAEYDDAVVTKSDQIRSHGAYLYGVIKRYVSVQERAVSGTGEGGLPMGQELTIAVQKRLEKLVMDGYCSQEEMNEKVKSKIRMLSEKDALFAIEELAGVDRSQIRNFSSYFMGILNRYMRGERPPGAMKRNDDRKTGQRFEHYGRDDRRGDDRNRGRSPDREIRRGGRDDHGPPPRYGHDKHFDSYRRDRSRDRFDDDRANGSRNEYRRNDNSHRDRSRYDEPRQHHQHQQQQQQQQHQAPQSLSGQYGGYNSVPPPPPPRPAMSSMNAYPPQHQPPQQQMYMPPNQPQQMPNPSFQQQPPSQQHYVPQAGNAALYGTQVNSSLRAGPPPGPSFAPPVLSQQNHMVPQQHHMQPQYMGNSQQPGPLLGNQQQLIPPTNVSYGVPSPAGWQSQQLLPPTDILGLADKAASAVQALANQSALQASRSYALPMANPPPSQMSMQHAPNSSSYTTNPLPPYQQQQQQQQAPRKGRTIATMNELPTMVQYAVQNLQATGHVEGDLDEGILGMIKDLPEALALQSLQKFSSIDTSSMRNKTAYLAGVLRRELEKIWKR